MDKATLKHKGERGKMILWWISLPKAERGIALVSAMGVVGAISILSLSVMAGGLAEIRAAERFENRIFAFHLADGAIDQTIVNLRTNRSYTGVPTATASNGRVTGTYGTIVTQPSGNPDIFTISSSGAVGSATAEYGYQQRNLTAIADFTQNPSLPYGVFSQTTIQMGGNMITDAYDSRNGPYDPATATYEGHIGTNSTMAGQVSLSGGAQVKGDAVVGPGGNPLDVITLGGGSQVLGIKKAASAVTPLPPVSSCSNPSTLTLTSDTTLTLPAGTYCYSSVSISGQSRLSFTGPATVVVMGPVSVSGQSIGTSGNVPADLTIRAQGPVSMSGQATFYGSIYAPNSDVQLSGNAEIFGSFAGYSVNVSGDGKIHYDKALSSGGGSSASGNELKAWSEQSLE